MRARIIAILGLVLTAALLTTSACAASPSMQPASEAAGPARSAAPAAPPAARQAAGESAANKADQAQQNLPSLDRMIIRTVTMTIAVGNVQETFSKIEQLVGEQRGYLAGTQIRQDGDRTVANVTLRVPADPATYQATLERLRGLAERVIDEQSQAQDITEEYVDLESRLRNLTASEQSLLALLGKAQRVEDIIQIQRELTNVRGQIEQIQGRKQALERRADMATITLTIRESGSFSRAGWSPGATFDKAVAALGATLRVLADLGIVIAVFSPVWGGFLIVIWLFALGIKRLARRSPTRPPVAPRGAPQSGPGGPGGPSGPNAPAGPAGRPGPAGRAGPVAPAAPPAP